MADRLSPEQQQSDSANESVSSPPASPTIGGRAMPGVLVLAFVLMMGFLVAVALDANKQLPDLTQASSALAAALLGGVINPSPTRSRKWIWTGLAVLAMGVAVLAGVIVFLYPSHANAPVALTASIAALAGLTVKTAPATNAGSAGAAGH